MSNTLILNQPLSIKSYFVLNLKIVSVLISLIILFLIVFSILQINAYTKDIYLLKIYETKLKQLTQEQKTLEVNFSKIKSLNNLNNYVQNFEKTNKVEYIRVLESTALAK